MHVDLALKCIVFNDCKPQLLRPKGELLLKHTLFEVQKWVLDRPRQVAPRGRFAMVCCLTGSLQCGDVDLAPGEVFLVPAELRDRQLRTLRSGTGLLRVTIPGRGGSPEPPAGD